MEKTDFEKCFDLYFGEIDKNALNAEVELVTRTIKFAICGEDRKDFVEGGKLHIVVCDKGVVKSINRIVRYSKQDGDLYFMYDSYRISYGDFN